MVSMEDSLYPSLKPNPKTYLIPEIFNNLQRTGRHVDGGVDRANIVLLVVSTAHVESSMSLVLERSNGAGERHRRSND
jgi:hypothetical protein